MANKVYTIQVKDENLKTTVKTKSVKTKKTASEKEVETFGIVEINNASSKGKMKNSADAGFEKNVTTCEKKAIKAQVSKVDDYFDFSFRPEEKVVVSSKKSVAEKKVTSTKKAVAETKVTATKKTTAKAKKVEAKQPAQASVLKIDEENVERSYSVVAEACERLISDDDAARIISVARMGLLFDCDKCAINSCY